MITRKKNRITAEIAEEIKKLIIDDFTDDEIANQYEILPQAVYAIRSGRTWNESKDMQPVKLTIKRKHIELSDELKFKMGVNPFPVIHKGRFIEMRETSCKMKGYDKQIMGSSLNPSSHMRTYNEARSAPNLFN